MKRLFVAHLMRLTVIAVGLALAVSIWACETAEQPTTPVSPSPTPIQPTVTPTRNPQFLAVPEPTPTMAYEIDRPLHDLPDTSTPTRTPTQTPTPTDMGEPTPTSSLVPTHTPTPSIAPTSTPTNTAAPSETPSPTATSTPEATPTPEPTSTPLPEPTATSTPVVEVAIEDDEEGLIVGDETLWGELFETLTEAEVSCVRFALDEEDFEAMLARHVVSKQRVTDRHELEIWGCLSQENAIDLYLNAFHEFIPEGDRTEEALAEIDDCHRSLLQYVDFARYFESSVTDIDTYHWTVRRNLTLLWNSMVRCSLHDQSDLTAYSTFPVYEARPINFEPDDIAVWRDAVSRITDEERDCIRSELGSEGYESLLDEPIFDGKTDTSDVAIWRCLGQESAVSVLDRTAAFDFVSQIEHYYRTDDRFGKYSVRDEIDCMDRVLERVDIPRLIAAGLPDVGVDDYRHGLAAIVGLGMCYGALPSVVEWDDYVDDLRIATEIAVGSFVEGNIDAKFAGGSDRDVFQFIAVPGLVYELNYTYGEVGANEPPFEELPNFSIGIVNATDGQIYSAPSPLLWEPSTGGVHYLIMEATGPIPYEFEISISDYVDDFGFDFATATEIPIGGMIEGTIRQVRELDFFKFVAGAGSSYQLDVRTSDDYGLSPDADELTVTLIDTDRNPIGEVRNRRVWQAPTSGEFFLQASGRLRGPYSISVSVSSFRDDHGDGPGSATEITLDGNASGSIGTDIDEDYFYFDAESGQAYAMSIGTGDARGIYFDLVDAEGGAISTGQSELIWQSIDGGRFFIRIWGDEIGDYALSLNASDYVDDHRNNEATVVLVGQPVDGHILNSSDLDAFSFVGVAGQAYDIGVDFGTLDDVVMQLYDSQGKWLGGFDERKFTWHVWESGNYFVYLWSSDEGTYTFTVSGSDYRDDHGDDEEHATALMFGETVSGVIGFDAGYLWYVAGTDEGDHDMFSFVAERGQPYQIDIELGSLLRSRIKVFDASGDFVGDADTQLVWRAKRSGKHYLRVSGLGVGDYELTVNRSGYSNDHGDDLSTATSIDVGETLSGTISFEDERDFFRFTSTEGEAYQIDLVSKDLPFAKMSLHDADGTELGSDPSQLFARAEASKDFYIVVSPQISTAENPGLSSSLATGEYSLSIKLIE